jgi:hypothetical protein
VLIAEQNTSLAEYVADRMVVLDRDTPSRPQPMTTPASACRDIARHTPNRSPVRSWLPLTTWEGAAEMRTRWALASCEDYDDEHFDLNEWRDDPAVRALVAVLFPELTTPVPPPSTSAAEIRANAERQALAMAEQGGFMAPPARKRDVRVVRREKDALADDHVGRARRRSPRGRTQLLAGNHRKLSA